jgi:5-(carboxyamino)imidazole ribonucleotide synthase
MTDALLPGSTIGVFGSGQLGRMLGLAARPMGYRFACFSPEADSPAEQVADFAAVGEYTDQAALTEFLRRVDVVTFEFENVPAIVAQTAERVGVPVHPAGRVLHTTQNRLREKEFLRSQGLPVTPFAAVRSLSDLRATILALGVPAVLKSAAFGYDGKGQVKIESSDQAETAWQVVGAQECILEAWSPFVMEASIVAARGQDGAFAAYPLFENRHSRHILDVTLAPARVADQTRRQAEEAARTIFNALEIVGTACVELFVLESGAIQVNEIAPRPHNSGHLTIEAASTSQFEQQVRAICGLPLGGVDLRPAAMANLLGDLWFVEERRCEPEWQAALAAEGVKLHLYGKREPRVGRKMGHLTAVAQTVEEAERRVLSAREALRGKHVSL